MSSAAIYIIIRDPCNSGALLQNVMDSSGEKVKPYKGEVSGSATDAHHGLYGIHVGRMIIDRTQR